jgi:23S rRNA pseudouridine2605 synthase
VEERLQKIIASYGIVSRRKAEDLIEAGRVTVNGTTAVLGMKADPLKDHIKVNGRLIAKKEPAVYFAFHKPEGVITTLSEKEERLTVGAFLKKIRQRVYPIGRLDYNSEGLLLLTNDGELAHALMHPSRGIPKMYHVKVKGIPEEEKIQKLRKGIRLEDGPTLPAEIRWIKAPRTSMNSWLEVTIHEGRKRQIRRMFDKINHPVLKLKRVAINGIRLGTLKPGEIRQLTESELRRLRTEIGMG